tara:strand:+ start:184 stop:918 length:735 start_codon:yes stop_codon:yes gene_type:complete
MRTTEAVRWLLDRHKISIVEWNKRSGISRQQIHNWLNTKVENVRPQSLEKLAGAVGYKCEFEGNEVSLTRVKEIAGGNEMIETISYKYMTMLEGEVDRLESEINQMRLNPDKEVLDVELSDQLEVVLRMWRHAFTTSDVPMSLCVDNELRNINQAMQDMVGMKVEDTSVPTIDSKGFSLVYPGDKRLAKEMKEKGINKYRCRYQHSNGTSIPGILSIDRFEINGGSEKKVMYTVSSFIPDNRGR